MISLVLFALDPCHISIHNRWILFFYPCMDSFRACYFLMDNGSEHRKEEGGDEGLCLFYFISLSLWSANGRTRSSLICGSLGIRKEPFSEDTLGKAVNGREFCS